jgi:hypothetical protein
MVSNFPGSTLYILSNWKYPWCLKIFKKNKKRNVEVQNRDKFTAVVEHEGKDIIYSKETPIQYNLQLQQKEFFSVTTAFNHFN